MTRVKASALRFEGRARRIGVGLLVAWLLLQARAWCFPGVILGKDDTPRTVHTTHEVMMLKDDVSVITVMVDYDGPMDSIALLMPVPADVTLERVQAVKREFLSRLEQLSAPRYHAFYEKDPCEPGQLEQDWDVRYEAHESGFLAPSFMPPPERNWTVSNEIGIATKPVFKRSESEFRFHLLQHQEPSAIEAWLLARGYHVSPDALGALARGLEARKKLLVAEVNAERAELLSNGGLQLGGIRYFTRESFNRIDTTLGLQNSAGVQDLFLYVLHPTLRYQAKNYPNVFLPSNIWVEPTAEERTAPLYNALFDAKLGKAPGGIVTEFVWPTYGCGEPCPNAPLTLYELMSLGGDVMESEFVPKSARSLALGQAVEIFGRGTAQGVVGRGSASQWTRQEQPSSAHPYAASRTRSCTGANAATYRLREPVKFNWQAIRLRDKRTWTHLECAHVLDPGSCPERNDSQEENQCVKAPRPLCAFPCIMLTNQLVGCNE